MPLVSIQGSWSARCLFPLRPQTLLLQPSPLLAPQRQVEVNVRNKILYLIQAWAHAFRNEPKYKVVQDTYQIMKVEGELELPQLQAGNKATRSLRVVLLAIS